MIKYVVYLLIAGAIIGGTIGSYKMYNVLRGLDNRNLAPAEGLKGGIEFSPNEIARCVIQVSAKNPTTGEMKGKMMADCLMNNPAKNKEMSREDLKEAAISECISKLIYQGENPESDFLKNCVVQEGFIE